MIPKRKKRPEENVDAWLMSYADMITLLLCFFIIFVSVSEPKKDRLSEIADGMIGKFGAVDSSTPFKDAANTLQAEVEKERLYKDMAVEHTTKSISIELATHRFFKNNGADIDETMLPVLDEMASTLKQPSMASYTVSIESHTDDTKPQSGIFTTNTELSAVRAAKIADYLIKQGLAANHVKAVGYGDSRPKVPNRDANDNPIDANRARNQRVTIKVE